MYRVFAKSSRGYSHIQKNKPCQDYSAMYLDNQRALITACDGHGGKVYVRSNDGAQYASNALLNALETDLPKFKAPNAYEVELGDLCNMEDVEEAYNLMHDYPYSFQDFGTLRLATDDIAIVELGCVI